jgi:hypothetical protein
LPQTEGQKVPLLMASQSDVTMQLKQACSMASACAGLVLLLDENELKLKLKLNEPDDEDEDEDDEQEPNELLELAQPVEL